MNKIVGIFALSMVITFAGFAQTKDLKGPNYKNAKPSVKYEGNSSILIRENPNQFQGPEFKNFNPSNYEKEVIDSNGLRPDKLVASTEDKNYAAEEGKETIIYRRVETKDMNGKNTKGLKGPAYKNYKP